LQQKGVLMDKADLRQKNNKIFQIFLGPEHLNVILAEKATFLAKHQVKKA